jgi:hypothetical protein
MKNKYLTILFLFLANLSFGQEIVDTTKLWSTIIHRLPSMTIITEYIKFTQDTVIDAKTYKKVMRSTDEFQTYWDPYGYIRETIDKKVFYRIDSCQLEYLLFDFEASVNDTLFICSLNGYGGNLYFDTFLPILISAIDSIYIGSEFKRQFHINTLIGYPDTLPNSETDQYIEKVGSMSGPFHFTDGLIGGDSFELLCFWENDTLKYHNTSYSDCYYTWTGVNGSDRGNTVRVFPNPATNALYIDPEDKDIEYTVELFEVSGSTLMVRQSKGKDRMDISSLPNGLYFVRLVSEEGVQITKIVKQ